MFDLANWHFSPFNNNLWVLAQGQGLRYTMAKPSLHEAMSYEDIKIHLLEQVGESKEAEEGRSAGSSHLYWSGKRKQKCFPFPYPAPHYATPSQEERWVPPQMDPKPASWPRGDYTRM